VKVGPAKTALRWGREEGVDLQTVAGSVKHAKGSQG